MEGGCSQGDVETGLRLPQEECELQDGGDRAGQAGLHRELHQSVDNELAALEVARLSLGGVQLQGITCPSAPPPQVVILDSETTNQPEHGHHDDL